MKNQLIKRTTLGIISLMVIFIDQSSKYWASTQLSSNQIKGFIPFIIQFRLTKNTGAAFSILNQSTIFLGLLSLIVSIALIIWAYKSLSLPIWKGLGIAFLLGGSLGNGIDRWRLGYVTDFLELIPFRFPIFNFADIAINLALIFFLLDNIKRRSEKNELF